MRKAWEFVRKEGLTISSGLKKAWKEAKKEMATLRDKVIDELNEMISEASDAYDYAISENLWEKYGKSRTYFKVIETRKNSKHYIEYDFGYVDNKAEAYVPGKKDVFGKYGLSGNLR